MKSYLGNFKDNWRFLSGHMYTSQRYDQSHRSGLDAKWTFYSLRDCVLQIFEQFWPRKKMTIALKLLKYAKRGQN